MRWIIGDIHGMLKPLQAILRAVDAVDPERELLFLGDYVNRGPDSAGVVDTLLQLSDARFIRGNHDDIFDLVLSNECYLRHPNAADAVMAFKWFLEHGLDTTLTSYGIPLEDIKRLAARPSAEGLMQLTAKVPETHRLFFRSLPVAIDEEDFFICHATWPPDEPTESPGVSVRLRNKSKLRYNVLWGRFSNEDVGKRKRWGRTGYFGHTPVANYMASANNGGLLPLAGPQVVLLDTAAALVSDGRLTAYCPDNATYIQADRDGNLIEDD